MMEMDFKAERHNAAKRHRKIVVQLRLKLLYQFSHTINKRVWPRMEMDCNLKKLG